MNLCKCSWQWIKVDSSNPAVYTGGRQRNSTLFHYSVYLLNTFTCNVLSQSCYQAFNIHFCIFCFPPVPLSAVVFFFVWGEMSDKMNTEINFCLPFKGFDLISSADAGPLIYWSRLPKIPDIFCFPAVFICFMLQRGGLWDFGKWSSASYLMHLPTRCEKDLRLCKESVCFCYFKTP